MNRVTHVGCTVHLLIFFLGNLSSVSSCRIFLPIWFPLRAHRRCRRNNCPANMAPTDSFWHQAEQVVASGDFGTYSSMYHPDAVLVEETSTEMVQSALAKWEPGFADTAAGRQETRLGFRFAQRLHGPHSAHETGIFRYKVQRKGETSSTVSYVWFAALMVQKENSWLFLMEHQKGPATEKDWDSLDPF